MLGLRTRAAVDRAKLEQYMIIIMVQRSTWCFKRRHDPISIVLWRQRKLGQSTEDINVNKTSDFENTEGQKEKIRW